VTPVVAKRTRQRIQRGASGCPRNFFTRMIALPDTAGCSDGVTADQPAMLEGGSDPHKVAQCGAISWLRASNAPFVRRSTARTHRDKLRTCCRRSTQDAALAPKATVSTKRSRRRPERRSLPAG